MITNKKWIEYFQYLDELRESGETNMFGAASFLLEDFDDLDSKTAKLVLLTWMNTFSEAPVEERVSRIE